MQAKRLVRFYSKDVAMMLKVKIGKNNIIDLSIAKLAKLHNQSSDNKFAKDKLSVFDAEVSKLLNEKSSNLKKLKAKLRKNSINDHNTKLISRQERSFVFGNGSILSLIKLVEVYDLYLAYLSLSKSAAIFTNKAEVYSNINSERHKLFSLLSEITSLSLKNSNDLVR